jgi:eight-cysteine-cluster-containing protein
MRSAIWAGLFALVIGTWAAPAAACKCAQPGVERSYAVADDVLQVLVLNTLPAPTGLRRYLALTTSDAFKGCIARRSLVVVQTNSESSACGATFPLGSHQLLFTSSLGRRFGLPVLSTGTCNGNREWSEVTKEELAFLGSRDNCCGESCQCVNSEPVQCLIDPCQVSECSDPDATCKANYCGGCNAEWFTPEGMPATCEPPARPEAVAPCRHSGCSAEVCLGPDDEDVLTPCVVRPEFACLAFTTCAPHADGVCGFTQTSRYLSCLDDVATTPPPP